MNADTNATGPVFPGRTIVPAQRSAPHAVPTPRAIPAQRSAPTPVRHTPVTFAVVEPSDGGLGIRDAARSEVLHRHARLTRTGRPLFCTPSQAEIAGVVRLRQGRGTDGKVIYPTREAAEAAARELETLGSRSLRSYLCGRGGRAKGHSGHFHLASDTAHHPLTAAEVHARVPQQRGAISA